MALPSSIWIAYGLQVLPQGWNNGAPGPAMSDRSRYHLIAVASANGTNGDNVMEKPTGIKPRHAPPMPHSPKIGWATEAAMVLFTENNGTVRLVVIRQS